MDKIQQEERDLEAAELVIENNVFRVCLIGKLPFEQRNKGGDSCGTKGKSVAHRGTSQSEGPKGRTEPMCLRNKGVRVATG